jgi:hypothetical protein
MRKESKKTFHQGHTFPGNQKKPSQNLRQASLLARTEDPCSAVALGQPFFAWAESAWQSID